MMNISRPEGSNQSFFLFTFPHFIIGNFAPVFSISTEMISLVANLLSIFSLKYTVVENSSNKTSLFLFLLRKNSKKALFSQEIDYLFDPVYHRSARGGQLVIHTRAGHTVSYPVFSNTFETTPM